MLTTRQAASCENAKSDPSKCKCQCGGKFHGSARGAVKSLPENDPHFPRFDLTFGIEPLRFRIVDRVTGEIHDSKRKYSDDNELRVAAMQALMWLRERL